TQQFMDKLEKKLIYSDRIKNKIEIEFWDERMTTLSANRFLIEADVRRENRKKVVDQLAAILILQGYLDRNRTVKE
ncbi:MAG TPA: Holliday junction resolvase RuvX, partial [Fusibacter sp.]|nr:Holliday junction resolvase RuvX [Fusibacter sp.]